MADKRLCTADSSGLYSRFWPLSNKWHQDQTKVGVTYDMNNEFYKSIHSEISQFPETLFASEIQVDEERAEPAD